MKFFDSQKINDLNNDIWGESPLTFYFSFQGFFNRLQFFGAFATLNAFLGFTNSFNFLPLTILGALIVFYAALAVIQKRCRDIKMKGSAFIIIFSLAFLPTRYLIYLKEHNLEEYRLLITGHLKFLLGFFPSLYILVCLFLQIMPGRKQKDPDLISPLLKRPFIYFAICLIISLIICFLMMEYTRLII